LHSNSATPSHGSPKSAVANGYIAGWQASNEAVPMFGSLKTFVSSLADNARLENRFESKDCQLATAALLIRVATVESEMSKARQAKLHAVLRSCFRLDGPATIRLIDAAAAADRNAIDLYHFTRLLNDARR
jgi:uncharacterized tellurite resistance protein B-like protein